jgi:predicted transposase/invertase (TIGR01784 family)
LHYDAIMKSILQSLANSLTPSLTGAKPVELLSVEFGSVEKRVPDLVSKLDDGRIFHLEIQSANDPRMPQRMLRYWLLLRERYPRVPIVQHVLYIGAPPCSMTPNINEDSVSYRYQLTDIREIDEEVLLRSESAADRALAVLSNTKNERATVRRILASWGEISRREQADLVGKLMVLSGLRRLNRLVAEEVHNMSFTIDYMENETIRGWFERWREEGADQGQASLLSKLLIKRFGDLPPTVEQKLRSAHSEQLERWALRLIDASTLEEVFSDQ